MHALILAAPLLATLSTTLHAGPVVTVEPVILLENGAIAGCGLTSSAVAADKHAFGEMIAFRDGDRTAFSVRARGANGVSAVKSVRLVTTTHDTQGLFPPPSPLPGGTLETRAVLEGLAGSNFAQELMVMGGRFEIGFTDGETLSYELPRPMPHSIRQSYLNCAGDLFRPEHQ